MRDAAQGSLDAADHDSDVAIGFAAALGIDDDGAVGTLAALVMGGIAVIVAQAAKYGRVEVTAADTIDNDAHADAAARGGCQRLDELAADSGVVVGFVQKVALSCG